MEFGAEGVRRSIVQQGNRHRLTLKVRRLAKSKQSCGKARIWEAVMRKPAKVASKRQVTVRRKFGGWAYVLYTHVGAPTLGSARSLSILRCDLCDCCFVTRDT